MLYTTQTRQVKKNFYKTPIPAPANGSIGKNVLKSLDLKMALYNRTASKKKVLQNSQFRTLKTQIGRAS